MTRFAHRQVQVRVVLERQDRREVRGKRRPYAPDPHSRPTVHGHLDGGEVCAGLPLDRQAVPPQMPSHKDTCRHRIANRRDGGLSLSHQEPAGKLRKSGPVACRISETPLSTKSRTPSAQRPVSSP